MDINRVFGLNIMPLDSTLLFTIFIILLVILVIFCAYFIRKYWDKVPDTMYGRGRLLGALIIGSLIILGLFYLTAESTMPYNQSETKIPGLEVVNSTAKVYTFTYNSFIINTTVKNTGNSTLKYGLVNATGYDSAWNPVTTRTWYIPETLNPGQTTSFNITLDDPQSKVVRYKLVVYTVESLVR